MALECGLFLLVLVVGHSANSIPINDSRPLLPAPEEPPVSVLEDKEASPLEIPVDVGGGTIPCGQNQDCYNSILGTESECVGTVCHCKPRTSQSTTSHKCLIIRDTLGSGCEEDMQCEQLGETSCRDHICSCKDGAAVVGSRCVKQIVLGDSCDLDDQCVGGQDSLCLDRICTCRSGMVSDPSNKKCLQEAQHTGDQCVESVQCSVKLGDGASCQHGQCKCLESFHDKNKGCVKTLIVGDQCKGVDGECFLVDSFGIDRVECHDTCQCKQQFVSSVDHKHCMEPGQTDPGTGGTSNVYPVFGTIVTLLIARLIAS